jgi:hypothetical protein
VAKKLNASMKILKAFLVRFELGSWSVFDVLCFRDPVPIFCSVWIRGIFMLTAMVVIMVWLRMRSIMVCRGFIMCLVVVSDVACLVMGSVNRIMIFLVDDFVMSNIMVCRAPGDEGLYFY